ncbi:hypothetical protein YSY43_39330 [Paenibacillus sp. YSY-4.3]
MKAIIIEKYGKNVPFVMTEQPVPHIGEHDVLVEIHAASLNPMTIKLRKVK